MKLLILTLSIGLLTLVSLGCADNPTTTPGGDPLIYQGVLKQAGRNEEPLILGESGTIRIVLTKANPLLIELPPSGELANFTLGIGVGNDATGECQITFGQSLSEGDILTVLVSDTERCLLVFDDGTLPKNAVIEYIVTVEDVKG